MKNKTYIYPKGRNGLALQEARKFLGEEEADFIDDSDSARSLIQLSKQIQEEKATVLIASNWLHDQLKDKLQSQGITRIENGVKLYGERLKEYLKSRWDIEFREGIKDKPPLVGYILGGFAKEKHLGDIDQHLLQMGAQVVYICLSQEALEKNRDRVAKHPHLVANYDLIAELEFPLILGSKDFLSGHKTISAYTGHACCGLLMMYFGQYRLQMNAAVEALMANYDILLAPTRRVARFYEQLKEERGLGSPLVVEAGYPSLDLQILDYEDYLKNHSINSTDVIVTANAETEILTSLFDALLNIGMNIVFRPHPLDLDSKTVYDMERLYKGNERVLIDKMPTLSAELLARSITLISDWSSLAYSYPFTTLKPVILFDPYGEFIQYDGYGSKIKFFDENIHIVCSKDTEVVHQVGCIKKELRHWNESIGRYRKEELLNFLSSSEKIAEFLFNHIK